MSVKPYYAAGQREKDRLHLQDGGEKRNVIIKSTLCSSVGPFENHPQEIAVSSDTVSPSDQFILTDGVDASWANLSS